MSGVAVGLALGAATSSGSNGGSNKSYQCTQTMSNFNHKTSTVKDKQNYASCVDHFYPTMSPTDVIAMKFIIILTFLVLMISVFFGYKKDGWIGVMFAVIFPPVITFIGLILFYSGLKFIFS